MTQALFFLGAPLKAYFSNTATNIDKVLGRPLNPGATFTSLFTTYTLVDMLLHPLHVMQSRLILMDRRRDYRSIKSISGLVRSGVAQQNLFRGVTANIPLNLAFAFQQLNDTDTNIAPVLMYLCTSLFTYPILTALRRYEVQANEPDLLMKRYNGVGHAIQLIKKEEGVKRLYRGYFAHCLQHSILYTIFTLTVLSRTESQEEK